MESVLRGIVTYLIVWLIFRMAGKRSLAQITTFDFVLLLIISETTQAALIDNDNSVTNSVLLILTLVGLDILLSHIKEWFPVVGDLMDSLPVPLLDRDGLKRDVMHKERLNEDDILHAARELQGLRSMDQIEYAILEPAGGITIIPKA